jgi:replicative DNA helicase
MTEIVIGRSENDMKKYGTDGTIWIGKQYIKMGETMSLANKVLMDVVRPHVILVTGKRGEGKCLDGETPIILDDGSLTSIKDLAENSKNILALDKNLKLTTSRKTKFYMRETDKMLKIKLRTGKEINLTPEHPLLTINGWENVCNLKKGSRIATPRIINAFGNESMKEEEIKLLAYLISEGHLGNGFVLFANTEQQIIEDFKEAIKLFDKNLTIKKHGHCNLRIVGYERKKIIDEKRNVNGTFIKGNKIDSKSSIRKWLEMLELYNKSSLEKTIPECIFKTPKHQMALFLNRIFSCDGSIFQIEDTWQINHSSSSEKMIRQIQHLLLRFGIISIIKRRITPRNDNYELIIRGENVIKFIQEIGFFGVKETRQEKALRELNQKIRNPNLDTIPEELWQWYRPKNWAEVGRLMDYTTPKALRSSINYSPSRQKLLQIAIADNNDVIRQLAESDIYWDEIIEITEANGKFLVYDISVPELHNFVASDIIVHNSYTMAQMAEGIVDLPKDIGQNISMLFLDTMGIFWTMKYPNYREEISLQNGTLNQKVLRTSESLFLAASLMSSVMQAYQLMTSFTLLRATLAPLTGHSHLESSQQTLLAYL